MILDKLKRYLHAHRLVDRYILSSIQVEFSDYATQNNERKPRAFAFVVDREFTIFLARQFKALPARNQLGILIHEISHINLHTFKDSGVSEVETDLWIEEALPEADYGYETVKHPITGRRIKNIQTVSKDFVALITGE